MFVAFKTIYCFIMGFMITAIIKVEVSGISHLTPHPIFFIVIAGLQTERFTQRIPLGCRYGCGSNTSGFGCSKEG